MSKIFYGQGHIENKITNLLKPLFSGNKQHFLIINNLVKNWEKIVSKKYANFCYPKSINFSKDKKAKLTIAVFNSAIGFAIENNSEILLEKIANLYGYKAIHKITIVQEAREIKAKEDDIKLEKWQEEKIKDATKNITNQDLAKTIEDLGKEIFRPK